MNPTLTGKKMGGQKCQSVSISSFAAYLFASLLISSVLAQTGTTPATQKRLDALRLGYEGAVERQAGASFAASVKALDARYLSALDRAIIGATQGGKLDEAIALRDEKTRISAALPLPETDAEAPKALHPFRSTYRDQLAALITSRDKAAEPLKRRYIEELEKLQADCTKSGLLDDAIAIRGVRESINAAVTDGMASSGAAAAEPELARGNGKTDSKAAKAIVEWALTNGTVVETDLGRVGPGERLTEIPKGRFRVLGIASKLVGNNAFPWEQLEGLSEIQTLAVSQAIEFKAGNLQCIRSLDRLSSLTLTGPKIASVLEELPSLHSLEHLRIDYLDNPGLVMPALRQRLPNLQVLGLNMSELDVPAVAEIAKWPKLRQFHTLGPINSEMGRILERAAGLSKILFYGSAVIDPSAIERLRQIEIFAYQGMRKNAGLLRALATLPRLRELTLGCDCFDSNELDFFIPQKGMKDLRVMHLTKTVVDAARHLPAIARLTQIENLRLNSSDLTDADLLALNVMKSLRRLELSNTPGITDAGVAAFSKLLPKCQVVR